MERIHLSPPDVGARERELLIAAFDSNWIAPAGPDLAKFEEQIADWCGRRHAVALSSGTAAIHLGFIVSGVQRGDDILVSTFTFSGSVNPVAYVGARPVFVDSEDQSWNIDPSLVERELARRVTSGETMPVALLAVDLYGQTPNMPALFEVCERYGVPVYEDAAEAVGTVSFGKRGGSFGSWSAVSFNGNKIATTGGGGAFVTDDEQLAARVRSLSTQARLPVAHYEHAEIGYNYRLSNLLAAVGRGQLESLQRRIDRRREIFEQYQHAFVDVAGLTWQPIPKWSRPNHWLSCLVLDPSIHGSGRTEEVRLAMEAHNIETRPLWKPMHRQPIFERYPSILNGLSDRLFENGMCLPSGSSMTDSDLDRVIEALAPLLRR